ncbi:hypothetical protein [Tepidibacter hydrothermalis]|uniref:Uncharacterized protein n=1 Tax=Tepidibacter hydrothermalis TaxID=3036126 RepID=A0ABY8ECX0_9FIRM|nr:hypothetical protein [Tepidibacter hydrothermalis]WFD09745.1 hypothetical protein P4S50_15310 [Tepidibacter hydrothermalis]
MRKKNSLPSFFLIAFLAFTINAPKNSFLYPAKLAIDKAIQKGILVSSEIIFDGADKFSQQYMEVITKNN